MKRIYQIQSASTSKEFTSQKHLISWICVVEYFQIIGIHLVSLCISIIS